jgi:glycine cleavage system H lipoate-binding protein
MPGHSKVFDENKLEIPAGLYYDRTHTWAFLEADGMVKTGIDDFLQHVTGPITSLGMKIPGSRISKGDQLCILIQNGKHLVIYAPVSGIIREHNTALSADSSMINTSPYSGGWIYRIEPTNWLREVVFLSMANKYRIWLNAEFTRLKDFLATAIKKDMPQFAPLVLQDGGALKDEVLSDLGPEIWEEFQTRFIDTSR